MRSVAVALVLLSACGGGEDRARGRDCEAVLAHLVVLEKGELDQPMCKYHPSCDGERADRYDRTCPKVLTRKQASCYLRATNVDDADDCLDRDSFDDAIRTGRRSKRGGGGDDPWTGSGSKTMLGQMEDLRDDACACKDKACADAVQKDFEEWARRNASATTSTDPAITERITKLAMEFTECTIKVTTDSYGYGGGYGYGYGYPDAGVPDANTYYKDPFNFRGGAGSTGMPACDEYFELIDDLTSCSAYPASARDAMRDAADQMRKGWGDPSAMSDYMKQSTNDTCRAMVDSTRQYMRDLGC